MPKSVLSLPSPLNGDSVPRCWSEIPPELLDLIAKNIFDVVDYIRFRAVCPMWRKNLVEKPDHLRTHFACLMLRCFNNNIASKICCPYINLIDMKIYSLELPEVLRKAKRCWGSPHGWLVILQESGRLLSLLNPLTRLQIQLPPLVFPHSALQDGKTLLRSDSLGDICGFSVVKALLFANPSVTTDFIVVVILEEGPYGLAFFRAGGEAWIPIANTEEFLFHDVICFEGKFYAVDEDCCVYICNLDASPKTTEVAEPPFELENDPEEKYLVESAEGLLLVSRYHYYEQFDYYSCNEWTFYFKIHKLDLSKSEWTELQDLGDQILFLGTNCSFSVSAQDYPVCEKGSIYFSDEKRYPVCLFDDSQGTDGYIRGSDMGVFNISRKDVRVLPLFSANRGCTIKSLSPPPLWFTLGP